MFKKNNLNSLIIIFFILCPLQIAYAGNDSTADNGKAQNQPLFPFDQQCLNFNKANFKVGLALLVVMKENDFPQYCVLYSLSNYQVKQKAGGGYFIAGSKSEPHQAEATIVFLKSDKSYQQNQILAGNNSGVSQPIGQWAYFVGSEEFVQDNGAEKEIYVFQEIDF